MTRQTRQGSFQAKALPLIDLEAKVVHTINNVLSRPFRTFAASTMFENYQKCLICNFVLKTKNYLTLWLDGALSKLQ